MNNRTITAGALGAVLIVALWWMFVFSGIRSESSDVSGEIDTARAETRSLETNLKQLEDLEARAPETEALLGELQAAVPQEAELASFIDEANALGTDTGVTWVSVTPAPPTAAGSTGTIQFTMVVEGGYFQVLDYLNRVENMTRLVVVDGITVDEGGAAEGEDGPPTLTATLTARMFTQNAPSSVDGATTAPEVAGGGGVAATPSGVQES